MRLANDQLMAAAQGLDRIVMKYVEVHGEEILSELMAEAEEDAVYAEIVEEETVSNGRDDEELRVDTQVEESS